MSIPFRRNSARCGASETNETVWRKWNKAGRILTWAERDWLDYQYQRPLR
jgi:hypothetical protein